MQAQFDPTDLLLALIGIGVTIVSIILGYIVREIHQIRTTQLAPMMRRLDTLWHEFFGVKDHTRGFRGRVDNEHKSLRHLIEDTREEQNDAHNSVRKEFESLNRYLRRLAARLEDQNIEVPDPDEDR